jgi:sec-independent protein translocase protein TatA
MFRNPTTDLIIVLVIVLVIFGPKRLPKLGRELGRGMREFKDSITGNSTDEEERPAIARTSEQPADTRVEANAALGPKPVDSGSERGA